MNGEEEDKEEDLDGDATNDDSDADVYEDVAVVLENAEDDDDDDEFELPPLPIIDKGPPPDCGICGEPMAFIDGDWACVDCNGELLGPETG